MNLHLPWPRLAARLDEESLKLAALRVFVGSLLVYRESLNAVAAFYHPAFSVHLPRSVAFVGIGILLLAGLGTRVCYLVLSLLYIRYNFDLGVMNLGPLLFVPLCWAGVALDREPRYSIDRLLMARSSPYRRFAEWPGAAALPSHDFVYVLIFLVYAVNSAAALTFHLRDPYWLHGQTVHAMLTNNFLSRHVDAFRAIEARAPAALDLFSTASIVVQTVFQLLMLPLMFFRWGRWFVVVQGFAFFVFSFVFLQISLLPSIELATWALIFGSWIRHSREYPVNAPLRVSLTRSAALAVVAGASLVSLAYTSGRAFGVLPRSERAPIEQALIYLSIWPPDVFNVADLRMGERWFVVYRVTEGGERQRVHVLSEDGRRLLYHLSDVVYFGHTLIWRRGSGAIADWNAPMPAYLRRLVERLCELDFNIHGFRTPQKYEVDFYGDRSMHLEVPARERYRRRLLKSRVFVVD